MRVQFFETLWEQFRERLLSLLSVGNDFQSISVPKELSTVPIPFPWNNTFVIVKFNQYQKQSSYESKHPVKTVWQEWKPCQSLFPTKRRKDGYEGSKLPSHPARVLGQR